MRLVEYMDEKKRQRRRYVRDGDPDEMAEQGVPQDPEGYPTEPPNVDLIDWEVVKTALHNELVNRGLFTMGDLARTGNQLTGAVTAALLIEVKLLYRRDEQERIDLEGP